MNTYIKWAERQHSHDFDQTSNRDYNDKYIQQKSLVRQVLTSKGREFWYGTAENWYTKNVIVYTKFGPTASQLDLLEWTLRTLIKMMNTMRHQSEFSTSFWVHALVNVIYLKNRVWRKGAACTPYEALFGSKTDIHHLRHVPASKKKKLPNAELDCC